MDYSVVPDNNLYVEEAINTTLLFNEVEDILRNQEEKEGKKAPKLLQG